MKIFALVNTAAGSVGPDGMHRMQYALSSAGCGQADVISFDADEPGLQIADLTRRNPDLLVVWGGDGTHRTALQRCGPEFGNLLLLPGGTMNLLTKWIHGPHPWDRILRSALGGAVQRELSAGAVENELFFCALLAGVPARLAQAREDVRIGDFGRAIHDVGVAVESTRHLHLAARIGEGDGGADNGLPQGNVIAALVGPLARNHRMEIAGLNLPSAVAAVSFAWSSIRSDWHNLEGIRVRPAERLEIIDDDGKAIPVIMDGETVDLGSRFLVRFQESAARCLVAL